MAENTENEAINVSHAKEISKLQADDHVISAFFASNARPLIKESSYFEFLHPDDRDAIEESDAVLADDFSSIVDYRNSQAHPRRLVHEAEEVALSLLHNIEVEHDTDMLSKAMRTFDRMKNFDGINKIVLNCRKKMKDKRKYKTLSQ